MPQAHVLIAAGHGLRPDNVFDNGAYDALTKTKEHDLNICVASFCAASLARHGVLVSLDTALFGKAKEPNWSALAKYVKARGLKFDLALEIHHDSPNAVDAGFGILPKNPSARVRNLDRLLSGAYQDLSLRVKPSYVDVRGLGWLRSFQFTTLLWECGTTRAVSSIILTQRGEALALGILKYLAIPYVAVDINSQDTIKRLQQFFKMQPTGVKDPALSNAIINWKVAHDLYKSDVITPYILIKMGL